MQTWMQGLHEVERHREETGQFGRIGFCFAAFGVLFLFFGAVAFWRDVVAVWSQRVRALPGRW